MATFGEVLHTGVAKYGQANPFIVSWVGHWKLGEPAGSTVLRNTADNADPATHGAPVGDVTLGQGSLIKQSPNGDGAALLGPSGGYIEVPDHSSIDCNLLSIGIWFRPVVDMIPIQPPIWAKFDELSGSVVANEGYSGAGTYFNSPALNQVGALPRTKTAIRLDGVNQYVSFPHHVDQRLHDGFVIAWHGAHDSYAGGDRYVWSKDDDTTFHGFSMRRTAASTFVFRRNNQSYAFTIPAGKLVNQMHHYAVWYDVGTSTLRWLFDGVLQATFTGVTWPDSVASAAVEIGRGWGGIGYEQVTIDNFVMYNIHPVTHPGYMTLKRVQDLALGLVMCYPTGRFYGLVGKDDAYGLVWNTSTSGGGLTLEIWIGTVRHVAELGNQQFNNDQTYFISGSYNGATLKLQRNGVEIDTTATGGGDIDDTSNPLRIGVSRSQTPIEATVDEVILFNSPIFDSGVTGLSPLELYTAGITERTWIECPPAPTPHRERVIYIRPDIVGNLKYLLHAPPSRAMLSEEGFGTPPLKYVTDRAPFQHGDTVRSFHLEPRQVQLVVMHNFTSRATYQNGRAELLRLLRPSALQQLGSAPALSPERQGKLLCYLGNGTKRQLDVLLDSGPGFAPPQGGWREWSFTEVLRFTAHNPLWYDPLMRSTTAVASGQAQIIFPLLFPITVSSTGGTATISYTGDWQEYPKIIIYGPITSPSVQHQYTGAKIELLTTIPAGYAVVIDLQQRSVLRSDGMSLLGYVSEDSDLTTFALEPDPIVPNGLNVITIDGSGTTVDTQQAVIQWYNRYIGI